MLTRLQGGYDFNLGQKWSSRTMKTTNLGKAEGLPTIEWSQVEEQVADLLMHDDPRSPNRSTFWLTTLNTDGSPHVTSVGTLWHAGSCWFQTGEHTRKARNVARDPALHGQCRHEGLRRDGFGRSPARTTRRRWPRSRRCGPRADGLRSQTTRGPASPRPSTRRRSDHRRGSSTKSNLVPRPAVGTAEETPGSMRWRF